MDCDLISQFKAIGPSAWFRTWLHRHMWKHEGEEQWGWECEAGGGGRTQPARQQPHFKVLLSGLGKASLTGERPSSFLKEHKISLTQASPSASSPLHPFRLSWLLCQDARALFEAQDMDRGGSGQCWCLPGFIQGFSPMIVLEKRSK